MKNNAKHFSTFWILVVLGLSILGRCTQCAVAAGVERTWADRFVPLAGVGR